MELEREDRAILGNLPLALHSSSLLCSEKRKGHAVGGIRPGRSGRSGSWGLLERTAHTLLLPVVAIRGGFQLSHAVVGRDNQGCGGVLLSHTPWWDAIILVKGIQKRIEHRFIALCLYHLNRQNAKMFGFLLVTQGGVCPVL